MNAPTVVIVGAGFAGIDALKHLVAAGCQVVLIDRHPYTTFQPLLYQVATGGLNPGDVTYALRGLVGRHRKQVRFRRANVTGIDAEQRRVIVDNGDPIAYDYLLLSQGVGSNFFGIPGADEYARCTYTRAEALEVRDVVFGMIESLAVGDQSRELVVMIVGGGATGVEMAGTLAEMRESALPVSFPEVDPNRIKVMMIEMGPHLLAPFKSGLRDYTHDELAKRGVDIRLNTAIKEVREDSVRFDDDTDHQADLVIWAAGVGGHSVVEDWGVPLGKAGRIEVDDYQRVKGHDRIYAAGDACINPDDAQPQLAQPAKQMGARAAKNIIASAKGQPEEKFQYRDLGTMAAIGRNAAVLQLPNGFTMKGLPAWVFWVVLHLALLLGGRNRIQAMINLGVRYLGYPRNANAIVGDLDDQAIETGLPGKRQNLS